jgi:hypothetical protein
VISGRVIIDWWPGPAPIPAVIAAATSASPTIIATASVSPNRLQVNFHRFSLHRLKLAGLICRQHSKNLFVEFLIQILHFFAYLSEVRSFAILR